MRAPRCGTCFPTCPRHSGYSKRLGAALPQLRFFIRALEVDTDLWADDVWVADSTPVECGRSCRLPVAFALTNPNTDE
jgi:hypothetical protein